MDMPNTPDLEDLDPQDKELDPQDDIKDQAAEIAAIVERDRKRRNRAVYSLLGLLGLTVALAGVVFAYGFSDKQAMNDAAEKAVNSKSEQQVNTVLRKVEKELTAEDGALGSVVDKTVEDKIEDKFQDAIDPTLHTFANQIQALEDRGTSSPPPPPQFTFREVGELKKAISDLPRFESQIETFAGRLDEIATASTATGSPSWKEDRSEVLQRLKTLEGDIVKGLGELARVSDKLDKALQQIGGGKDPCSTTETFRTYTAKENTTSRFHDLDFKVKLKGVKDRTVRGLTIFRTSEHVLLAERDVMMGDTVSFEDNNFRYTLIPIFINKRLLINDFVGFAISKTQKCPTPNNE